MRQLESAHQKAVRTAQKDLYAAVPARDKQAAADRLHEQARTEPDSYRREVLKDTARGIGSHKFAPPTGRWAQVRRTPRTPSALTPQDVLDKHSGVTHEHIPDPTSPPPPVNPDPAQRPDTDAAPGAGPPPAGTTPEEGSMSDLDVPDNYLIGPPVREVPVAATDGDNRYKAVQQKLTALARTLDSSLLELEQLHLRMKANATRSEEAARAIAAADVDPTFVEMQNAVSLALGGAQVAARRLGESGREVSRLAHEAQTLHASLYQGLDDIRSSRRERTPKPGFFAR
ncbi:hypothetical protein [Streptomyces rishiriensis]|uniref:Uncharacterized protein n=1 Tax=Streptomyces rishiriensis TaxID=68264 RepID=A0ABU0NH66_STRRH|nr:hypothetical protein [Streptomyces rishiriensis]MDQ0577915.1 hypothetical protein [Streptomyces rishiriensis]